MSDKKKEVKKEKIIEIFVNERTVVEDVAGFLLAFFDKHSFLGLVANRI